MQLVLEPSTCPTVWQISYIYHDVHYTCMGESSGLQPYFEVSGCCGTILSVGISGDSFEVVARGFEQIAPLLDPAVAAGLRATLSDKDRLHAAAESDKALPTAWPNVRARYTFGNHGPTMDWTLEPFWPDE